MFRINLRTSRMSAKRELALTSSKTTPRGVFSSAKVHGEPRRLMDSAFLISGKNALLNVVQTMISKRTVMKQGRYQVPPIMGGAFNPASISL